MAKITRGERFTAEDYVENGGVPCIHYGEIYTSYGPVATETFSHVREEMKSELRFAEPGDVIVATTSENVEDGKRPGSIPRRQLRALSPRGPALPHELL